MALILSPRAPLLGLLYPSKLLEDEYMLLLVLLLRSCTHARTFTSANTTSDFTLNSTTTIKLDRDQDEPLTELSAPRPGLSL